MDTDDLSTETYKAIFYTSENYHHYLTLQFGLLASHFKNDYYYLDEAIKIIENWKSDIMSSLNEILIHLNQLHQALWKF